MKVVDHKFVPKVWGYEVWIHNDEQYCGKILFIKKGHYTSWHQHRKKTETIYVQSGRLHFMYEHDSPTGIIHDKFGKNPYEIMEAGESTEVKPGLCHRLYAKDSDCYLIEFSTQHFDEDSYRFFEGR